MTAIRTLQGAISGLCIGLLLMGCARAAAPSYATHGAWSVACDNTLSCDARGFDEDSNSGAEVVFTRAAGPAARTTVTIYAPAPFARTAVRVDDRMLVLPDAAWVPAGDGASLTTDRPAAVAAFIDALRHGAALHVGTDAGPVPLDGMVAALSGIDDRQGRAGGRTALVQRGPRRASAVPAAPAPPVLPAAPTVTLSRVAQHRLMARARRMQARFIRAQHCAPPGDRMRRFLKNGVYGLDDRNALVIIGCEMGPYQGSSLLFVASRAPDGPVQPARLLVPVLDPGDSGDQGPVLTNPDLDPATGTLGTVQMGRALDDCGMQAAWRWDHTHFVLARMTLQRACGGSAPRGDWPVLYRSVM